MSRGTGNAGHAVAATGGAALAASLWLPWYSIHIPQAAIDSVVQMSQQLGALGPLVRSGAQLINQLGPFHVTAWQAFSTTPAVVLGAAIIGGGLALLALTDRAGSTSQLTMLAGIVAALLVGYRIAVPPSQSGFVHPAWGTYLALVSALAMLAGGALAGRDQASDEPMLMAPGSPAHPVMPAAPIPASSTDWTRISMARSISSSVMTRGGVISRTLPPTR